jgi:hypothetical protein
VRLAGAVSHSEMQNHVFVRLQIVLKENTEADIQQNTHHPSYGFRCGLIAPPVRPK